MEHPQAIHLPLQRNAATCLEADQGHVVVPAICVVGDKGPDILAHALVTPDPGLAPAVPGELGRVVGLVHDQDLEKDMVSAGGGTQEDLIEGRIVVLDLIQDQKV